MSVVNKKAKPESRRVGNSKPTFVGEARPKYLMPDYNVFDATLDRMRWLFEQFDGKVAVSNSGGKDSTVVVEMAARVAKEMGCGPLVVQWLDQETEFQATVDYQRYLMYERDDIDFRWYQIPFLMENSTNHTDHWLKVWDEDLPADGSRWMRPKEPGSIHVNRWGEQYFHEVLARINEEDWQGALLDGMRVEESPARRLLMTSSPAFKWVTWSTWGKAGEDHREVGTWRFQPIWDWSVRDVWKAIHENGWRYNDHYNALFQRGVPIKAMRVSNFHHETALGSLYTLQEIEPETWERATMRLEGISTYAHLGKDQYPKSLPYMFASWVEYAQFLLDRLPTNDEYRDMFAKQWRRLTLACPDKTPDELAQVMVGVLVGNDFYGTHVGNYLVGHRSTGKGREDKGKVKQA